MDKALSFFRVFDLAFFAPGALLVAALHYGGYLPHLTIVGAGPDPGTAEDVVTVVIAIGMIYVIGLTLHTMQRLIHQLINWRSRSDGGELRSWYQRLPEPSRVELAFYFWYMRATCWNLGLAFLITAGLLGWRHALWLLMLLPAAVLYWQGCDFDQALRRVMDPAPP